jgi:hypothetical protein
MPRHNDDGYGCENGGCGGCGGGGLRAYGDFDEHNDDALHPEGPSVHEIDDEADPGDEDDSVAACPHCGRGLYADVSYCPHCGLWISPASNGDLRRGGAWLVLGLLAVAGLAVGMSCRVPF